MELTFHILALCVCSRVSSVVRLSYLVLLREDACCLSRLRSLPPEPGMMGILRSGLSLAEQNFVGRGAQRCSQERHRRPNMGPLVLLCLGLQCRPAPCSLALPLKPGLLPFLSLLVICV